MKKWSYSLLFLAIYLGVFNLWVVSNHATIVVSGLVTTLVMLGAFVRAAKTYYFVNFFDCWLHAIVILDVLAEALLIPSHEGRGFYLCALAFAVVIGGYRAYIMRNNLCPLRFNHAVS